MPSNARVLSPRHGPANARAGSGPRSTGVVIRCLVVGGLVLAGIQGWVTFMATPAAPPESAVSKETIAGIQITLGQAALALREFGQGGLLSDRFQFESGLSGTRRSIDGLKKTVTDPRERQALDRARDRLDRLGHLATEHIARIDAGGGPMAAEQRQTIAQLRDDAALALAEFRQVKATLAVTEEADPLARLVRGAAGAGAALLSLCVGAITLWSRLFSV